MYASKRRRHSSFGPDGRRINLSPGTNNVCVRKKIVSVPKRCLNNNIIQSNQNKLFSKGVKLVVQRAPIMQGLSIVAQKKFQRPMLGRRAYDKNAEVALRTSTLGQRKRMDGMARLMARAGKGLSYKSPLTSNNDNNENSDSEEDEDSQQPDEPTFEPLCVWTSPHQGGECKGLPPKIVLEMQADEYGIEQQVSVLRPAPVEAYGKENQFVPAVLAKWLRPHQREGVKFMYECVMGMRNYDGNGCILADDMGLGKTLQSVTLIYTLLKTGITPNRQPTARRIIVVCPCSLVKNWDNEFSKWLGAGTVKTLPIAEADRKTVEKNLDAFVRTKLFSVLICSYECLRSHVNRLTQYDHCCDLLVCDEAHRLKNSENQTSQALNSLPCKRRVLLTGTPMQNDLQEFFAMTDFTNPGVLGTQEQFRKNILFPILRGREPDATKKQKEIMMQVQNDMSTLVNEFILRRINTLNAQHLPPKLVQVVCCNLTEIQQNMYQHLVNSKDMQHVLDGKQVNCLSSIQMLMKLANHPRLVAEEDSYSGSGGGRRASSKKINYNEEEKNSAAPGADGVSKYFPMEAGSGRNMPVRPEWSGKMFVLYRLMKEMRRPGNGNDKIVIVSNYTQTLDLIGRMCRENTWGFCRLDGSISMKKRQKMVDEFNDPSSSLIAFLLSSKAGGCGLNLIGGNRLVLFDPDWNPAVDKQAAARCWRDGQKKRCFTYRFLATGTVEEKIFQRQLSKEGLQSVVDDKEQVNALSTKDLRNLFHFRSGTPSDTHDKLRCERCKIIADDTEQKAMQVLPQKLSACRTLLDRMMSTQQDAADYFSSPIIPTDNGKSAEEYDKSVKQPMDLGTIKARLDSSAYKSISSFSKDVNRIFANVLKVWDPEQDEIAAAARRLQTWWVDEWTDLVPKLMTMKADTSGHSIPQDNSSSNTDESLTCAYVNNERGENFQEQIGMPDEENMRHWSHHFGTDTVDDPVFRAAMRGTDAVSFVFGLEVTWSLIQQRQQEEEEKEAMLELQRLEQLEEETKDEQEQTVDPSKETEDEASNNTTIDDNDCNKNYVSDETNGNTQSPELSSDISGSLIQDEDDEIWTLEKIYSETEIGSQVNCQMCDSANCNLVACSIWKSNKEKLWHSCLDCQEEEFSGWPTDKKPSDLSHLAIIHKKCSNENIMISEDDDKTSLKTDPTESEREKEAKTSSPSPRQNSDVHSVSCDEGWSCAHCTFVNNNSVRKCGMCSARRPKKGQKRRATDMQS